MGRVQRDDVDAFEQLFDRHAVRALRVAASVCRDRGHAEDAVQEGFLSIWRGRADYRPEKGTFRVWSMSIVRFRAVDAARRVAARPPVTRTDAAAAPEAHDPAQPSPEDQAVQRGDDDALHAALARLPEAQAEVIALAYFGELTHTEIARHLDLPSGTVKGRMRLGLEKLRRHLGHEAD